MENNGKTVLITGANSGIGFETAYQLAKAGYEKVILGVRSSEKGETAKKQLIERGAPDVYDIVTLDTSETASAIAASDELISKGYKFDVLILNAGMSGGDNVRKNSDGVDLTFASTLVGHHALTVNLLKNGAVSQNGRIIIAGSEAARGDMPGISLPDLDALAKEDFNGNMHDLLKAYAEGIYPAKYVPMDQYALAKLYVAWWAASLAKKLPDGITVNVVSPGSVPSTGFARDMPWAMRNILLPIMTAIGPMMGMAGPISDAGKRYLDAADYSADITGKFFASPPKKAVGKLEEVRTTLLQDEDKQEEGYKLIVELTGGLDYRVN